MTKLGFEPESLAKFERAILRPMEWPGYRTYRFGQDQHLYSSIARLEYPELTS